MDNFRIFNCCIDFTKMDDRFPLLKYRLYRFLSIFNKKNLKKAFSNISTEKQSYLNTEFVYWWQKNYFEVLSTVGQIICKTPWLTVLFVHNTSIQSCILKNELYHNKPLLYISKTLLFEHCFVNCREGDWDEFSPPPRKKCTVFVLLL